MTDPRVSKASKLLDSAERLRVREDLETNLLREAARSSETPRELAERLVALISTGSAMVDQIAAVTFTRKATAELRERFRGHLGELAGDEAADSDEVIRAKVVSTLDDMDQIFIDAIHIFCIRLLRERALGTTCESFSWSGLVHGALAATAVDAPPEVLRNACQDLLAEYAEPINDSGEPLGLTELVKAVETVCASELWGRARQAEKLVVEVPLLVQHKAGASIEDSRGSVKSSSGSLFGRQIEMFPDEGSSDEDDPSEAKGKERQSRGLEGMVDLAFREEGSWVIADYKTDLARDLNVDSQLEAYRQQVDLYADAWARLTGDPIKERILFFTAQDRVESW